MKNYTPNDHDSESDLSPMVRGYLLGTQVFVVTLEMVVPVFLGFWADRRWGTTPLFVLLGVGLGLVILMFQLMKLASVSK